jgi:hypothetical protein
MTSTRSPLTLVRRWSAGALLGATLAVGAVGLQLADHARATTTAGATTKTQGSGTQAAVASSGSSSGSTFASVPGVSPGTSSSQWNSSAS